MSKPAPGPRVPDSPPSPPVGAGVAFATTRWSVVLRAGRGGEEEAAAAIGQLYEVYWYPLYAYIRRRGLSPEEACDHIQEVFLRLMENRQLASTGPDRGRFRSYLLAAVNHQMAGAWRRERRQKRGGGVVAVSLDAIAAEQRYWVEPADTLTPERLFDRRWALALLDRVFARLRGEWAAAGKAAVYDGLSGFLSGDDSRGYAAAGQALGLSEGAARVTVHRLRHRYRELLRDEVANTVEDGDPARIDDELKHLLHALRA